MTEVIQAADEQEMSRLAAEMIKQQILKKPDTVLGLATGTTPIGTYDRLAEAYTAGEISFREVSTVNLDEYLGLDPSHPQSYRYFMNQHLFGRVDIDLKNTHVPGGNTEDPELECASYDALIRHLGGIDLQLLGIGHNGHIGFNEPDDVFIRGTHPVTLTERTIRANARLFESEDQVPRKALTMGMGAIMGARKILLIASGEGKADALGQALNGPITPRMPASILQLHPDVTVIADRAALGGMSL